MPSCFHIVGIVNDLCSIYIYIKVLFHSLFLIYSFILKAIKVLTQEISFLLTLSFHLPTEIEPPRVEDHLRCSWYQQLWALTTDEKHYSLFLDLSITIERNSFYIPLIYKYEDVTTRYGSCYIVDFVFGVTRHCQSTYHYYYQEQLM